MRDRGDLNVLMRRAGARANASEPVPAACKGRVGMRKHTAQNVFASIEREAPECIAKTAPPKPVYVSW